MALAGAGFTTIAEIVAICRRGDRFFRCWSSGSPSPHLLHLSLHLLRLMLHLLLYLHLHLLQLQSDFGSAEFRGGGWQGTLRGLLTRYPATQFRKGGGFVACGPLVGKSKGWGQG